MLKYFKYSVNTSIRSAYAVTCTRRGIKIGALKMQFDAFSSTSAEYLQKI